MMVRATLHGISTLAAVFAMQTAHAAPMWVRMTFYLASWIACAAAYVPILYVSEHLSEAWEERTRRIVREELDRRELLAYQRRIESENASRRSVGNDNSGIV